MSKTMDQMNNNELFDVLTGGQGIMAQYQLQQILMEYRRTHKGERADLQTMVQTFLSSQAA